MVQDKKIAKDNVKKFSADVSERGGYEYTTSDKLSTKYANNRMLQGLIEVKDFCGLKILDLGCGDGVCTLDIARLGAASILGIDPVPNAIETAIKRAKNEGYNNVQFQVGNIYELDIHQQFRSEERRVGKEC